MTAKPTKSPVKIAICFPSGPMVHVDFMISTAIMMQQTPDVEFILINNKSPNISVSRNACVAMAQEANADYLFFIDSDMDVPSDTLTRFLSHNKDIVGANYRKRSEDVGFAGVENTEKPENLVDHGLLPAMLIATGCLLIKMSVFDHLPRPYFLFALRDFEGKEKKSLFGEDYVFSVRAINAGYQLWFDMDVTQKVKHIGQIPYTVGDN
ncbi:MAG: glycosyl transferase family 2 [Zymomonas mobilis subsp. pomaceae]|uniref:Glycosyl transferase family 2 n=1 Tax=Zymomonas mobilis subsp. pomaceae (strain ATCC 29192 / DSM 22645 / JCM 10191 / CCUG 17912 / NBRC 13757 / NCIMB 11200 / NRRL B-4491 / Barker I) TaxID=579138 RepID=F8ERP1_ZYMMT|nr:glycosyl transferase family 2 [Zymomonas mobilis]AEI37499.1 hypothetical protein Zymop_0597 [Zymomonas mobilis subsp. pomaceae ATCC 29192]MDX5948867.1 glycosyl transferase family 2 [Zymomonas mobilis subsp. pomaceae]GEB88674.1 hypothetical protein ZMO02_03110 [Zymomonas mobilis subsp. pomaceae]